MPHNVHNADVLRWIDEYEGELFHTALFDPPYHLTSITKRFSKDGAAPAQYGKDGAFARASRGFMNSTWDGGRLMYESETWEKIASVLYDGAFGMAFASTRGYHRMAVACEDAGFIIHPMICWTFSSGFCKATRIDTQIDRAAGATRIPQLVPTKRGNLPEQAGTIALGATGMTDISQPVTALAKTWAGHRYGGQALVPSLEPILVFQKPYGGRTVDSIVQTGAGALNIEAARLGESGGGWGGNSSSGYAGGWKSPGIAQSSGRWPKNFILSHSPDCAEGECTEDCPVRHMDEQTGELSAGGSVGRVPVKETPVNFRNGTVIRTGYEAQGDEGGGSRYFFNADYVLERLEDADPFIYAAKASTAEREAGLHDLPLQKFGQSDVAPTALRRSEAEYLQEHIGLNVIKDRYNVHPCVKPLALVQHLASLLLPPAEYAPRRLFTPFCGTGSEMIGAMLAGWEHVDGIEMEAEYVELAEKRLAFWQQHKANIAGKKPRAKIKKVDDKQRALF